MQGLVNCILHLPSQTAQVLLVILDLIIAENVSSTSINVLTDLLLISAIASIDNLPAHTICSYWEPRAFVYGRVLKLNLLVHCRGQLCSRRNMPWRLAPLLSLVLCQACIDEVSLSLQGIVIVSLGCIKLGNLEVSIVLVVQYALHLIHTWSPVNRFLVEFFLANDLLGVIELGLYVHLMLLQFLVGFHLHGQTGQSIGRKNGVVFRSLLLMELVAGRGTVVLMLTMSWDGACCIKGVIEGGRGVFVMGVGLSLRRGCLLLQHYYMSH